MAPVPALVVIQASSRAWSGAEDFCLRSVDGEPAVARTIRRAIEAFPAVPVRVAAPGFDRGGRLDEVVGAIAARGGDIDAFYGFDGAPLDRLLAVSDEFDEAALLLRADGLHFGTDFALSRRMLDLAEEQGLDCVKAPDDFPPFLGSDVYRVGALRRARRLIKASDDPFLVHPKFLMFHRGDEFATRYLENLPDYPDEFLQEIRAGSTQLMHDIERHKVDDDLRVRHGDQLSFHYELAARYLPARPRMLDVACGDGFGVRMLAGRCASAHGVDLHEPSIAEARRQSPQLGFTVADCTDMPFEDDAFDAVLSMETIEHVPVRAFLREVERVLAPGGVFIASTPQSSHGHVPFTPAHEREYSLGELTEFLAERFEVEERIGLKAGTIFFDGDPVGTNSFCVCRRPNGSAG
jgi:2-polyprenyl-3-methyl-5-hydroxy-6-metoxy-1,4-benzoquinol methylase